MPAIATSRSPRFRALVRPLLAAALLAHAGLVGCAAGPAPAPAAAPWPQTAGEVAVRDSVLATVEAFFHAMAANDSAAARAVMMDDGQYYATAERADGFSVRRVRHEEFIRTLVPGGPVHVERMWNPVVHVHGRIAVVWTPYDIYRDGVFQHCGVDAFSLIRTESRWQIAGIVYTIEPTGCAPSPLGPLR
jgi:hypothetical protein